MLSRFHTLMFQPVKLGRGAQIRTESCGFGDRYAAVDTTPLFTTLFNYVAPVARIELALRGLEALVLPLYETGSCCGRKRLIFLPCQYQESNLNLKGRSFASYPLDYTGLM